MTIGYYFVIIESLEAQMAKINSVFWRFYPSDNLFFVIGPQDRTRGERLQNIPKNTGEFLSSFLKKLPKHNRKPNDNRI